MLQLSLFLTNAMILELCLFQLGMIEDVATINNQTTVHGLADHFPTGKAIARD